MMSPQDRATLAVRGQKLFVRQFEVTVVDGPDRGATAVSRCEELAIGTNDGNDLRLADPAVSRHHCTLRADERGLALGDLGSRNGTFVGDTEILGCYITSGARIRIGATTLAVRVLDHDLEQPIASAHRHGPIVGGSAAMRRLYPLIEQYGRSNATVLIAGETGTGKELFAEALHEASERRNGPFIVVDCGALSHDLAESELFGHERGSFTGADIARTGAFEAAERGTVFLDEIGELPLALQPMLLRVLENRTIRRVGSNQYKSVDVRVVAASHRDLRVDVNNKQFRADLYYRLNVLRLAVPPLRERAGDIQLLASHFWKMFRPDEPAPASLLEHLASHSWPGNVRELRNAVERAAHLGWKPSAAPATPIEQLTYQQAKEAAVWTWERGWVEHLLASAEGNLSRAARAAKMGRSHLRELARKHGVTTGASADVLEANDDEAD